MINRPRNGNYNMCTSDCERRVTIRLPVARAISHRGAIPPPATRFSFGVDAWPHRILRAYWV